MYPVLSVHPYSSCFDSVIGPALCLNRYRPCCVSAGPMPYKQSLSSLLCKSRRDDFVCTQIIKLLETIALCEFAVRLPKLPSCIFSRSANTSGRVTW